MAGIYIVQRVWSADLEIVLWNLNFFTNNFFKKREYIRSKPRIMRRNVSEDWVMFKETKLLMYFSRGNHGYVVYKTNNFAEIL